MAFFALEINSDIVIVSQGKETRALCGCGNTHKQSLPLGQTDNVAEMAKEQGYARVS